MKIKSGIATCSGSKVGSELTNGKSPYAVVFGCIDYYTAQWCAKTKLKAHSILAELSQPWLDPLLARGYLAMYL